MALEFTDSNFQEVALDSSKPVMVDFGLNGVVHVESLALWLMNLQTIMKDE